jgi:hypothetical protein
MVDDSETSFSRQVVARFTASQAVTWWANQAAIVPSIPYEARAQFLRNFIIYNVFLLDTSDDGEGGPSVTGLDRSAVCKGGWIRACDPSRRIA